MSDVPPPAEVSYEPAHHDLVVIAHMCGYDGEPTLDSVPEIIRKCAGFPQGVGLALFAFAVLLGGGSAPAYSSLPIPYGMLDRVVAVCAVGPETLESLGIVDERGYHVPRRSWALIVLYRYRPASEPLACLESSGGECLACHCVVARKMPTYERPWKTYPCPPDAAARLCRVCLEGGERAAGEPAEVPEEVVEEVGEVGVELRD